jgi:GDSL-like Lipase/Acylhydrolase
MPWNMEHLKPDVALLYIQSDVSNVNEGVMTPEEKAFSRQNYTANMDWIVKYITKREFHVLNMALIGPGIQGEGPFLPLNLLEMSVAERFRDKQEMLQAYIQMNKEIAKNNNIPHIDIYAAVKSIIPWYRLYFNGYATRDGEHPNERGTEIQARLVSEMLLSWFQTYDDSIITTPRLPVNGLLSDDQTHRALTNIGDVEGYETSEDVWNDPNMDFVEFESSAGVVSRYAYLD